MPKVFFIFKMNKMESFCNFYPNLPKTSFTHKISKIEVHTWNKHLLNTQNGNFGANEIDHFVILPKLAQHVLQFKNKQN